MPHFVIDCSQGILLKNEPSEIIEKVYATALETGLFSSEGTGGIKVRIQAYEHYTTVNSQDDFVHVFANIMEGRTAEQKKILSKQIVGALKTMLPQVPIISMNVQEFERESYCNKSMV